MTKEKPHHRVGRQFRFLGGLLLGASMMFLWMTSLGSEKLPIKQADLKGSQVEEVQAPVDVKESTPSEIEPPEVDYSFSIHVREVPSEQGGNTDRVLADFYFANPHLSQTLMQIKGRLSTTNEEVTGKLKLEIDEVLLVETKMEHDFVFEEIGCLLVQNKHPHRLRILLESYHKPGDKLGCDIYTIVTKEALMDMTYRFNDVTCTGGKSRSY